MALGLTRLSQRRVAAAGVSNPAVSPDLTTTSGSGVKPNSTVTVYRNGTQAGTATANGSGAWSYTFGNALAAGDIVTYDAILTSPAYTVPSAAPTAPAAPTIILTPGNTQVSVAWTDGATNGAAITSHKLYRGTASGSRALVGTISTASPFVDTGLTNGTAYFYSLSAVNSAGEGSQSAEASVTPGTAVPMVIDSDMATDSDDAVALAVANSYMRAGTVNVIAAVTSLATPYNAQALKAFFGYAGYDVPVGCYKGGLTNVGPYDKPVADAFSFYDNSTDPNANYPDAVTLLRQKLAASPGGVVYVTIGNLTNLANLLKSAADGISPLTGVQLVAAKVARVCSMGGNFDTSTEYNIDVDRSSAIYVTQNLPCDIYWSGFDVGQDVYSGPDQSLSTTINPYRLAIETGASAGVTVNGARERQSWDPCNVLFACGGAGFTASARGDVTIDSSSGIIHWAANPSGKGFRVTKSSAATLRTTINAKVAGENRPIVTPPQATASLVSAGSTTAVLAVPFVPGATSFDYVVGSTGGTPVSLPANLNVAGLPQGTTTNVYVRAVRLGVPGPWSSAVSVTTTAAAFAPSSLFGAGDQGGYWGIDPAYCYSDLAGTTLATVGGPVGRVKDQSGTGGGVDMVAISSADAYILRQSGTGSSALYYLEGDGTKKGYVFGTATDLNFSITTIAAAAKLTTASSYQTLFAKPHYVGGHSSPFYRTALGSQQAPSANSIFSYTNGVAASSSANQGLTTPFVLDYKSATAITTKNGTAVATGTGAALTYPNNVQTRAGSNGAGQELWNGLFYGFFQINRDLTTTELNNLRSFLNSKLA